MLSRRLIVKYLLCLMFLCQCNGAPYMIYTDEEDNFIIKALLRCSGDTIPVHSLKLWATIEKKHAKMRKSNPTKFPKDRSAQALHSHFCTMLRSEDLLPPALLQKIPPTYLNRQLQSYARGSRRLERYTPEEDKMIVDEALSFPSSKKPFSKKMWSEIAKHHQQKREKDPILFPVARSGGALSRRFGYLVSTKINDEERDALLKKYGTIRNNEDVAKMTSKVPYTKEEHDFIIDELLQTSFTSVTSRALWRDIAAKHNIQWSLDTPGFERKRSDTSLRLHFTYVTLKKGPVPTTLMDKFPEEFSELRAATQCGSQFQGQHTDLQDIDESDREYCDFLERELEDASELDESDVEFCDLLEEQLEVAVELDESDKEFCDLLQKQLDDSANDDDGW